MSLKWPNKDPDETLDYSIDWSRFLDDATISSFTWFVYDENDIYQDTMDFIVVVDKELTPDVQTSQFVPARDINMENFEHVQRQMASFVEVEQMFATMGKPMNQ